MSTQTPTMTVTDAKTVNELFLLQVQTRPDAVALRRKIGGNWEDITWKGYYEAASKLGRGLVKLGMVKNDAVALLSNTRAEWAFADMGILGSGGITVPIYQSNLPDEVKYILDNSDAKFLLLEDLDQWKKCHQKLAELDAIQHFVIFDTGDTEGTKAADVPFPEGDRVMSLDALLELGETVDAAAFEESAKAVAADDIITYIYTSGTTGHPKGVVLTHECAVAETVALVDALKIEKTDVTLMFLPLAHVFARALHWCHLRTGYITAFAESLPKLMENMAEVSPTFLAAVPRIYEKIHAAVMAKINATTGIKKSLALGTLEAAMEKVERAEQGQGAGLGNTVRLAVLGGVIDKISSGLRAKTGGKIRFFVSGGAPLSREIAVFLKALQFNIYEGYGLTETTAATHINRPGACKLGFVGQVVKGVQCKIAPDGEILVKGKVIMREYYKRPEATAEVLKDGWLHTGDIGEIDADGFLKITDRKKDIIVTAAGKNIAPQNVENHMKTLSLISQVALFGDKRKFCVALITVDEEVARKTLSDEGITVPESTQDLVKLPRLIELVQAAVDSKNETLPSYETIKYFELLPKDFEIGDELTPTLKVKRKVVKAKYGDIVDKLYADHGG